MQPRGARREVPREPRAQPSSGRCEGHERIPSGTRRAEREYLESGKKAVSNRKSHLKRKYGLTLAQYDAMLEVQDGVGAICRQPRPEERTLHVDHDHDTGAIRGLLCFTCNNALGDFRDEPDLFQAAAEYLDRDDELATLARNRVRALVSA